MVKCFKCEKEITAAVMPSLKKDGTMSNPEEDTWSMPCYAVHFMGGSNFGSRLYDALMDGIYVELLICDECLKVGKTNKLLREIKGKDEPKCDGY